MTADFVVRLLDAENNLLAWTRVQAESRRQPDRASGFFSAVQPVMRLPIERDGVAVKFAVQWPDLDIARVKEIDACAVKAGELREYAWMEPVWLIAGMQDVPLPAVTERQPVRIGVPPAALGMKDPRT